MNLLCPLAAFGSAFVRNYFSRFSPIVLFLVLSIHCVCGQSSVTLGWNPSTNPVSGYRLYRGTTSHTYTWSVTLGNVTQATVSGLTAGTTYYFAVTAYNTNGVESTLSTELSFTTQAVTNSRPPNSGLTFSADSGTLTGPFVALNGVLYQTLLTGLTGSGEAIYPFTIQKPGNYIISTVVNAPDTNANAFYVNIDAEPTDPLMIWDVLVTSGFTNRNVAWRGNGNVNVAQFGPKVFTLAAGQHQLIIRGKDPNTQLQTITITPLNAQLDLTRMPGNILLLGGIAPIGKTYDVQASRDFKTWTVIGSVSPDSSGVFSMVDPAASSLSSRFYRLHQTSP